MGRTETQQPQTPPEPRQEVQQSASEATSKPEPQPIITDYASL